MTLSDLELSFYPHRVLSLRQLSFSCSTMKKSWNASNTIVSSIIASATLLAKTYAFTGNLVGLKQSLRHKRHFESQITTTETYDDMMKY